MKLKTRNRAGISLRVMLLAMLAAAVTAAAGVFFLLGQSEPERTPSISSATLKEELQYVQDLVSMEYNYSNADKVELPGHVFQGWQIPLTGKRFIIKYDGVIKYGIDMASVEVEKDDEAKTVTVTIPPAKIISHEIPEESYQTLDERDGLFNPVRIEDDTSFRLTQKAYMEARAAELGFPRKAQEQAGNTIRAFYRGLSGLDGYEILIVCGEEPSGAEESSNGGTGTTGGEGTSRNPS